MAREIHAFTGSSEFALLHQESKQTESLSKLTEYLKGERDASLDELVSVLVDAVEVGDQDTLTAERLGLRHHRQA